MSLVLEKISKNLKKWIKNPGKAYVEWLSNKIGLIDVYYQKVYRKKIPPIQFKALGIAPYYDDSKDEKIVIPIYTYLDLFLLPILPLFVLKRIWYLSALPAFIAHEASHSMREQTHSLARKEPNTKNIIKGFILYLFSLDKELYREEKRAALETRKVLRCIDPELYKINPFYSLNEAIIAP